MKNKKFIMLMSLILSLNLLGGCSDSDTISESGENYVKDGTEYVKVEPKPTSTPSPDIIVEAEPIIYEPGTLFIQQVVRPVLVYDSETNGYYLEKPTFEAPEGYSYCGEYPYETFWNHKDGYVIRTWVNNKTIVVERRYNVTKNIYYTDDEFGTVLEEESLKLD